ncbi:MAG TPA: extracellular solute-binding protein, partial [Jatrophihabitantaceae bacterium]|nr:extracellular solute-binding protein [Jatrophihabitantaceae bacterium]
ELLLVSAVAVAVVAGCSSSSKPVSAPSGAATGTSAWDQIVNGANAEGSVTLYTPTPQTLVNAWTTAFEKAYPKIKLSVYRDSPGAIDAKLIADQQTGSAGADVVLQGVDGPTTTLATDDAAGKLVKLAGPDVQDPDMKAAIESPNRFWVYAAVWEWAWNTQLLPNGIHSWKDFLNSDLSNGKVAVWDPTVTATIPAWYNAAVAASGDPTFLKDLGAQKPGIYKTSEAMENALASGEVAATMFASKHLATLKAQGAPVDFAVPTDGAGVAALEVGVLKSSKHPDAAQVLTNWLATENAQELVLATGTPARANVPGNSVDFATLKPNFPVTAAQQEAFVGQFNALFRN